MIKTIRLSLALPKKDNSLHNFGSIQSLVNVALMFNISLCCSVVVPYFFAQWINIGSIATQGVKKSILNRYAH